jgi:hypothetical protein
MGHILEFLVKGKKVKLALYQAVEAHRVVRHQGSHIFYTDGGEVVGLMHWLSFTPRKILVLISIRG